MHTETKTIRVAGKTYKLPEVLRFRGEPHFYEVEGFRAPKQGERYVSGAIPEVYTAPNDLSTAYLVVRLTDKAKIEQHWVRA